MYFKKSVSVYRIDNKGYELDVKISFGFHMKITMQRKMLI
jgi:hypothetical protein